MARVSRRTLMAGAASLGAMGVLQPGIRAFAQMSDSPIKIGVIAPLSGGGEVLGTALLDGASVAADQINAAGGVDGHPIELVVRDDKLTPQQAVLQVQDLLGQGVNMFVGGMTTGTALALSPLVTNENAIFTTNAATGDQLTHEDFHPNFFRMTNNAYTTYRSLAKVMAENAPTAADWIAVMPDAANTRSIWASLKDGISEFYASLAGKQPTFIDPIITKVGAADFKNVLAQLMASPATAMFTCAHGADNITLLTQAKSYDIGRKFDVIADAGGAGWAVPQALGKKIPASFWMPVNWYYEAYQDLPEGRAFYDGYVKRTGKAFPDEHIEPAHATIHAYALAVKKAGSTETQAVLSALETLSWNSAKGVRTFRKEDHQCMSDCVTVLVQPSGDDQGWTVAKFVRKDAKETLDEPTPGVPLKYRFQ